MPILFERATDMSKALRRHVVLFGPPGAGKGAQAELLERRCSLGHLSTGDVLREEIKRGTALGSAVKAAVESGRFADDETVIGIIASRIDLPEYSQGFVLDGFPRNVHQAEMLDRMLAERGKRIEAALFITAPDDVVVERLAGRRVCSSCGATYHAARKPPRVDGVCDRCGGEVVRRPDDDPRACRERLRVYEEQTSPLVEYYRGAGTLVQIDGDKSIEAVFEEVAEVLRAEGT